GCHSSPPAECPVLSPAETDRHESSFRAPAPDLEFQERNFLCRRSPDTAPPLPSPLRTFQPSGSRKARLQDILRSRSTPPSAPPDTSCSRVACGKTHTAKPPK